MKKTNKGWGNVSVEQFNALTKAFNAQTSDEEKFDKVINIIYGIEHPENLPLNQYAETLKEIQFIKEPIKPIKITNHYTINGNGYTLQTEMDSFSTAQYIDLTNYAKNPNKQYQEILSVVLIPDNAKGYNDGYSIKGVQDDILAMDIQTAFSIATFFLNNCKRFTKISLRYLTHQLKGMKGKKAERMAKTLSHLQTLFSNLE